MFKTSIKIFIKPFLRSIPRSYFERSLSFSIMCNEFSKLMDKPQYANREDLWKKIFDKFSSKKISFLEFGVWEGKSIKKIALMNSHVESIFVGFDSFIGLPENWHKWEKGALSTNGEIPKFSDPRISFIKGWFQNTLPGFIKKLNEIENLIVHFDADLYSSTLFVLMQLENLKKPYIAIFDEFPGHESRALFNFMQSTNAEISFIGFCGEKKYPIQVACQIIPK